MLRLRPKGPDSSGWRAFFEELEGGGVSVKLLEDGHVTDTS